jgi:proteasome accessory factor B
VLPGSLRTSNSTSPRVPTALNVSSFRGVNRLERLINLVAALLDSPRPLTADELRGRVPGYPDEVGAFRRAFERDKDALREMGVPLVLEAVGDSPVQGAEGYRIPKDAYYLPDPGLATDELAALHLAASAVELEGAEGLQALWKLGGLVAEAGPTPARATLPAPDHLAELFGSISESRPVSFEYRGQRRTLDPHALTFRNGHWYVVGRDHAHDDQRSFRVDRIESPVVAAGEAASFVVPETRRDQPPPWQMGDESPVEAELLVDADQAAWASAHVGAAAVREERPDGSVVLAVPVTNREAFRSFALGFLDHAEVLGPPELRADVVTWLEALCRG